VLFQTTSAELKEARRAYEKLAEQEAPTDVILKDAWERLFDFLYLDMLEVDSLDTLWNKLREKTGVVLVLHYGARDDQEVQDILRELEVPNYVQVVRMECAWAR